ncbi:LysR substrate-binding domain-containing protein [Rhodoferax sp. PAMC 29310]|uniref:choline sulfate utilization transcriptional regulator n=1 Tax=Rhodoferax sp. PAMC 29310 TaxID=2822760 RepID=UPI001B31C2C5|nr:LysR substrate-binding domain-containing protein [Rhodoferax sp. PAMC 29310]
MANTPTAIPRAIPSVPLELLRTFDVCARLLSFTAAAQVLGTTQPAISQHIKRLEESLGTALFERVYRGLKLTPQGLLLLAHVQRGLESLDLGVQAVRSQPLQDVLRVATDFAFAAYWLMPRLPRFHQQYPHIDVNLLTGNRSVAAPPIDADLSMVFGDGHVKHAESHLLFREEALPVCSPRLLHGLATPSLEQLLTLPLLQLKANTGKRWYDWPTLLKALGLTQAPTFSPLSFDNYTLLIQAALAGQGVAIGWRHLVDDLITQGLLCPVGAATVVSDLGYYLVLPERKRRPRAVQLFVDWIREESGCPPPVRAH